MGLFLIPLYSIFIFFSICITEISNQCLDDQRSLLLQMKNNLIFDASLSTKLVKWDKSMDCCSWDGVTCNDFGYVIGLDLSSESISGGIDNSSSLFNLQYLQSLNLADNRFHSVEIPSGFGKLTGLIYLNFSNAHFAGQIPIDISYLTKLVTLDFFTFFLTTSSLLKLENPTLAMLVHNLTELQELRLDGVNISAQGKDWCHALSSSLPNLQVLSLSGCYLSGLIDSSLLKLQALSVINLNHNNLNAPVPEFFANFTNLTFLSLHSSGLYGTFPKKIFQVTTLQTLDLSNNLLLQGSLPEFQPTSSLQMLVLTGTNFSGKIPDSIGNLKKLSSLDLGLCYFSGSIPNSFANLDQLVDLDLSDNDLSGPIPSIIFERFTRLENIVLSNNSFNGKIPLSMFANPSLRYIDLSFNQLSGQFDEFPIPFSSVFESLDLSTNNLEGPIPMSVFELQSLESLDLSSNNFSGTIELSVFEKLKNLSSLDISYNNLSVTGNSTFASQISELRMASCNLKVFPNLRNLSSLFLLDLSQNQIHGKIPNWISTVGDGFVFHLNLSCNFLVDVEQPFPNLFTSMVYLDLHSNMLQGKIPILATDVGYLDYSDNNLTSHIPAGIGNFLASTHFFSLSGNKLIGNIPESICEALNLEVLDLSHNALNGQIPSCLVSRMTSTLGVLNLGKNNLHGSIPRKFSKKCSLRTLDLSGNMLKGQVPKALANCKMLEVIDLGNNKIKDNFPCWLKNSFNLRVLVLRFNQFQGPIKCPNTNLSWRLLQILDLASNNLSGNLPSKYFLSWKAMMIDEDRSQPGLNYLHYQIGDLYYQDSVMVISKGMQLELVRILTIFTSIDLSGNMFQGEIPKEVGHLKSLHVLNISHNALTGHIPPSMGNLKQLESLDLSQNKLCGMIPTELVGLTFLSLLNLSFNQLVGMIPRGNQFETFSETSFQGNKGLCGTPLKVVCEDDGVIETLPPTLEEKHSNKIKWEYISAEIGFVFGLGVVIVPPFFWKRWRKWYCKYVDRIVLKILSCQQRGKGRRARRDQRLRLQCW